MKTTNLKIKKIVNETKNTITIKFKQSKNPIKYKSGQFITLIIPIKKKKKKRAYSFSSSPYTDKLPAITIKKIKNGIMSNYLNKEIKTGDIIKIIKPTGKFILKNNNKKNIVLIGGGSGIKQLISILKYLKIP